MVVVFYLLRESISQRRGATHDVIDCVSLLRSARSRVLNIYYCAQVFTNLNVMNPSNVFVFVTTTGNRPVY
ncbi:Uncharacterised protein [BD1-7 clade bacterium]|uniref:Uncharacterized protein n=1 Tax=BD1-7 clade bacterium TaxID=2029982 RepID=A0A5S9PD61_9GAMM|nr:Uncharacterised protein [BD1-7 clade bacterium]